MRGVQVQGEELLAARKRSGLTQDGLAKASRVDTKTIRKAERGERIDVQPLTRLAYTLNVRLESLIAPGDTEPTMQVQRRDLILRWNRLWDAADMDGLLALYHDDAVLHLPGGPAVPFGGVYRGKAEIRRAHEIAWSSVRHEPLRIEELTILVSDEGVTIKGAKGIYLPNGELVRFPSLQTFLFAGNLIIDHHIQFDTLEFASRFAPPA
jgi:transcriptional regulator with XRE-family HTH domain